MAIVKIPTSFFWLEKSIKEFQIGLDGMTYETTLSGTQNWVELVYGISEKDDETGHPKFFLDKKDYQDVRPDDREKSFAFFYTHDPSEVIDTLRDNRGRQEIFKARMSVVVWYNQVLIDEPINRATTKNAFINAIRSQVFGVYSSQYYNPKVFYTKEEATRDFNLDMHQPLDNPFDAFRIEFEAQFVSCPDDYISLK